MLALARIVLKMLPWLLVVILLSWLLIEEKFSLKTIEGNKEVYQNSILTRVEEMGKLELVKYNFQEVTEIKRLADYIDLKIFKYKLMPDARAILISQGAATGCVDLSQVKKDDITEKKDTLYISLPAPELCYFKVDLEKSRIYDLQISSVPRDKQKDFMEELYKTAENDIKKSALDMGILEKTQENARTMLQPLLESIAGKPVIIQFKMDVKLPAETLK